MSALSATAALDIIIAAIAGVVINLVRLYKCDAKLLGKKP
jgi:hypothetical protein